jgi:hypothetical protein
MGFAGRAHRKRATMFVTVARAVSHSLLPGGEEFRLE